MHCKEAKLVLEVMDVDLQVNGDDCGLHAIATAYELRAGNDPTGITRQHDQLWSDLQACLEKQVMKPFPKKAQRSSGLVRALIRIAIFCVCSMPEEQSAKTAQCLQQFFEKERAMDLKITNIRPYT